MLDPAAPASPGYLWTLTAETDAKIRAFGKFPNIVEWLPADVLLVASVHPDWVARRIGRTQAKHFDPQHARWQHAAIYMGNGYVAEATVHGVQYQSINKYVGEHFLALRRNPGLSADQRWLVAIEAGVRLRSAYGFKDIVEIYRRSFPGLGRQLKPNVALQANAVICSQLCYEAHAGVESIIVPNAVKRPIVPAALSLTPMLRDVELHWCAIR